MDGVNERVQVVQWCGVVVVRQAANRSPSILMTPVWDKTKVASFTVAAAAASASASAPATSSENALSSCRRRRDSCRLAGAGFPGTGSSSSNNSSSSSSSNLTARAAGLMIAFEKDMNDPCGSFKLVLQS